MKSLLIFSSLALLASPVLADEVVIKPVPDVTVEHRAAEEDVTTKKTVRHGADGCDTKSVTKSNDDGDTVTKTKSNCD